MLLAESYYIPSHRLEKVIQNPQKRLRGRLVQLPSAGSTTVSCPLYKGFSEWVQIQKLAERGIEPEAEAYGKEKSEEGAYGKEKISYHALKFQARH